MLALQQSDLAKAPPVVEIKPRGLAREAAGSSGSNPVWQSLAMRSTVIQPKLNVGSSDNPYEQEADRVADQVARMPGLKSAGVSGTEDERAQPSISHQGLQIMRVQTGDTGQAIAPPIVNEVLNSPGQQLDSTTGAFFEQHFGQDFSHVRVHADQRAADSAEAIRASAYTVGSDIVFGSNAFTPETQQGRHLLAHELTHVVQQQQQSAPSAVQRQPINNTPVNVDATATEVETLVLPGKNEKAALEKLNALDMRDLLGVVEKLYNDVQPEEKNEGKRRAYGLLNGDLSTAPNDTTKNVNVPRLRAAFDAAPVRKQRNPVGEDPGTNPTLSGSRKAKSTPAGAARPGDWGEDPDGNTWVSHSEGIRTYFGTSVDKKRRSSAWLGNNPGNADYVKSITKRATGSFHWGKGVHDFAIYFSLADGSADLRDRVKGFTTIDAHVHAHLGNNAADKNNFDDYITNMQKKVKVSADDPTLKWTKDDAKWAELLEGYKSAELWNEGNTITAANVNTISTDPKQAAVVAYYRVLLGLKSGAATP
jgi:hypothetical protein